MRTPIPHYRIREFRCAPPTSYPICSRIAFSTPRKCCGDPYFISEPRYSTPSNSAFTGTLPLVPNSFSTSYGNKTYAPPRFPASILALNLYFFMRASKSTYAFEVTFGVPHILYNVVERNSEIDTTVGAVLV